MDGPQDSAPSDQSAKAGDGLASTLDQLAVLMAQAEELASWASATQAVAHEPGSTESEVGKDAATGSDVGAELDVGDEIDVDCEIQAPVESFGPVEADQPEASPGDDPIGAALMSMVADGRIAAVVVAGEGSAEVLGKPRCVEESSLAALGALAPEGAVLEVTTTQGELRALRVGAWTFAVEVGSAVPDDVDTLLGELLALSQEGISGAEP